MTKLLNAVKEVFSEKEAKEIAKKYEYMTYKPQSSLDNLYKLHPKDTDYLKELADSVRSQPPVELSFEAEPSIFRNDFIEAWKSEFRRYNNMKKTLKHINKKYNKNFKIDKTKYFRFLPENERKSLYRTM